jgi:hypothetical protein
MRKKRYNSETYEPTIGWVNETQLHADCKTVFDQTFPDPPDGSPNTNALLVHHQNNQTHALAGSKSAKAGVRDGMPDFQLLVNGSPSCFIELKTKTGRLTKSQKRRFPQLWGMGYDIYIVRSLAQFMSVVLLEVDLLKVNGAADKAIMLRLAGYRAIDYLYKP